MEEGTKVEKVLGSTEHCEVLLVVDKSGTKHILKRFDKQKVLGDRAKLLLAKREK